MTINDIKEIVFDISNKHQGEHLNGAEFNNHWRLAEIGHMEFLLGFKRDSRMGPGATPLVVPGNNARVEESLSPFRDTIPYVVTDGQIIKPATVAFIEAANKKDGTEIDIVSSTKLGSRLKSVVLTPGVSPFACVYSDSIAVYPIDIGDIVVTVINYPPFSKWGYTEVSGEEVYDPLSSTDPLWRPGDCYDIIARILKTIGVKINERELFGYAQSIINRGE